MVARGINLNMFQETFVVPAAKTQWGLILVVVKTLNSSFFCWSWKVGASCTEFSPWCEGSSVPMEGACLTWSGTWVKVFCVAGRLKSSGMIGLGLSNECWHIFVFDIYNSDQHLLFLIQISPPGTSRYGNSQAMMALSCHTEFCRGWV